MKETGLAESIDRMIKGDRALHMVDRLKKSIRQEGLRPVMKLSPERKSAGLLAVGRPVIREAIEPLSGLGVLESRRSNGAWLKSLNATSDNARPFVTGTAGVDLNPGAQIATDEQTCVPFYRALQLQSALLRASSSFASSTTRS